MLRREEYEPLLKEDLRSWRTDAAFKTIPKLKSHLEEAWSRETHDGQLQHTLAKRRREVEENDNEQSGGKKIRKVSEE